MDAINILMQTRKLIVKAVENLSDEAYFKIPDGFDNNIAWNIGHIIVVQQLLHYGLTENELLIPNRFLLLYRSGTSPAGWKRPPDVAQLISMLGLHAEKLQGDFEAGKLTNFKPYITSTGISLATIEEAIAFNNFHEGLHAGAMLSIKNFLDS